MTSRKNEKKRPSGARAHIERIEAVPVDPTPLSLEDVQEWPGVGRVEHWANGLTVLALPPGSYDQVWLSDGEPPPIPGDQEIVASATLSEKVYVFTVTTSRLPSASTFDDEEIAQALAIELLKGVA